MKIAVTYDDGKIFQHFGKTESFKVYEIKEKKIVSTEMISSNGSGHGALAGILAENKIDVVICGGLGGGAQDALAKANIKVCAGASGNVDEAVEAYLAGELKDAGATCDHHHGEDHDCGSGTHHRSGGCGSCEGGCGGCEGGCGGAVSLTMEGRNAGKKCKVHYQGTFNDGTQFDSSYDRGEPMEFVCATGMMIKGFDAAVVNMEVGEIVNVHLMPEDAYGMPNPENIFTVNFQDLPGSENLLVGQEVYLSTAYGQQIPVIVTAKTQTDITFDSNSKMAGKELNFKIELVEVE